MKYVFSIILFVSCVLAFYFAIQTCQSKERKYAGNLLFSLCCFSSGIWSLGFGALILQTDTGMAYMCRAIGMVGVFLYLITAQILVCHISEINGVWRYLVEGVSVTGIVIYFLVIQKDQVVYFLDTMGMTYHFRPGFVNSLYTIYSVVIAFNILGVTIHMIRNSQAKRIQAFGKRFLLVEILIVLGMMLDTVFPLLGISAIPGSSITQFWGLVVLYHAMAAINRSKVNITNMSEFIYYSLAMPVLVYDAERNIQIMNDAAADFFEETGGQRSFRHMELGNLFAIDEEEAFAFAENRKDIDAVCRKNQIYCSLAVSRINDVYGDTIGYIIIVTDLSERMKTVKKLEEAIEAAETANQAKSTFLANMSHEIRTPMNAIIGFSELLLKMELPTEVREYVEDIANSSRNLLAIINDILDISKIESGKMELVCGDYDTAGLFHDVYLIISGQAKQKGLEFRLKTDPEIPNRLFGDQIRIRGILVNLLNNAVKYTLEGSVSLEVRLLKKEGDTAWLEFRVADTGTGIRQEEIAGLFNKFSQADRKLHYGVEGTGLGLAIVKGYVTLMDGDVSVESVYGEGSVFTVVIAQRMIDEQTMNPSFAGANEARNDFCAGSMKISGIRVLVVDDNAVNRKVAGSSLKYYGLIVDLASGGAEAIELCRRNQYRIVFMDQMMPQMSGTEAMKQIRKINDYYAPGGQGKIVVLTANVVNGIREELLQEGFDEYLGKPMNLKQLEQIFRRFIPEEDMKAGAECSKTDEKVHQEEISGLQEMLPQVDVFRGMMSCGGHLKDYLGILQMIFRDGEKQLKELRALQEQQDYPDYTVKIHAMKGMALNVGAKQISDMAKQQETAGREGRYGYIDAHMEEFQQEYRSLLAKVRTVLEHYQMLEQAQESAPKEQFREADILELFGNIRESIEEYDFAAAAHLIKDTDADILPEKYRDTFKQIRLWMDEMEVEKILERIRKM